VLKRYKTHFSVPNLTDSSWRAPRFILRRISGQGDLESGFVTNNDGLLLFYMALFRNGHGLPDLFAGT
jgi:hypothetical protein